MENWLIDIMNEFGYIGIVLLIAIENILPPIPSEVILTFGGFMTTTSSLTIVGVVLSATLGSVIGAIALYIIGLQLDIERLEKIIDRWGHVVRIKMESIHRAHEWFDKHGPWTVFFCRFVPIVRSLISIPAGMAKMNIGIFLLFTTIGTLIWNIILVFLGAFVGNSWEKVVEYIDIYSDLILMFFFIIILILIIKRRRKRK